MPRRRVPAPLREVLAYRNSEVVGRFAHEWQLPPSEARRIFGDLLRFLWVTTRVDPFNPPGIIDEMWHTFLLYSARYREFSLRYFGKPMDHLPRSSRQKRASLRLWRDHRAKAVRQYTRALESAAAVVYEQLGARVAHRWFIEYERIYGPAFFATLRPRRAPM